MTTDAIQGQDRKSERRSWGILGGVGLCLVVAGAIDLVTGLYPFSFGSPEWEFGGIGNFLNRLPLLGLGLAFVLAAALARGFTRRAVVWSVLILLLAVGIFFLGLLFLTNLPIVMAVQGQGPMRVQLIKAAAKATAQTGVYAVAFGGVAIYSILGARRARAS